MLQILLLIFGVFGLIKGEFKITGNRRVHSTGGRVLGIVLILGALIPYLALPVLVIVIVIGLVISEPIEKNQQTKEELLHDNSRKKFYSGFSIIVGVFSLALGIFANSIEFTIAGVLLLVVGIALSIYTIKLGKSIAENIPQIEN